jgi:hypothetical protein
MGGTIDLWTNGVTALKINTSQNATFAGDVTMSGGYKTLTISGAVGDALVRSTATGVEFGTGNATNAAIITNGNRRLTIDSAGNATFAGKTCFDGTLYSDLYAAGSTIQLGNQFFVSEVAANRADMLLGMTLNAASDFESTGTIKPSGIVLQDGSIIFAVDGTTRTVGSAAAATPRLTITDTTATFAGSIDVGNDANVTGSATTGYIQLNGNGYNGWMSMDASSLHIGHNTSARNLILATNSTAALTIDGSQNATFAGTLQVIGGISTNGGSATIKQGNGSPEGAITAVVGSIWMQINGGAGSTLYVKESGTGNTGWSSVS